MSPDDPLRTLRIIWMAMVGGVVAYTVVAAIPSEAPAQERVSRYTNACIVALALMEGGGLLVITFGLLTGSGTWVVVGGSAAVVMMLMARPSRGEAGV